ncbi:rhamnogalacturonan acetylesterase [Alteribacillus sp. HJP-4]|uniref:rhamnogalacturonan acetylesterase n=1 Tax=Alteribacillus sp. HJP-4 TaxID=2775394 RepID=UPI0035CD2DB9
MEADKRIYLAGDSTVQAYSTTEKPQAGWGEFLGNFLEEDYCVCNRAIGGRSSKTFIEEGRWDALLKEVRHRDLILIQMGYNDSTKAKPERYTEPYEEYQTYLTKYVKDAKSAGAVPVLITPVGRMHYVGGEFLVDFGDYCNAMKETAEELNVPLIDLMAKSIAHYSSIGYDQTLKLFMKSVDGTDCTHFTEKGAEQIAALVADGLKYFKNEI